MASTSATPSTDGVDETVVRRCIVTVPEPEDRLIRKDDFQAEMVLKQFNLSCPSWGTDRPILLEDLVGITVLPGPPEKSMSRQKCRVLVNEFSLDDTRGPEGKRKRSLKVSRFDFDQEEKFEANHDAAEEWKKAVLLESYRASIKTFESADSLRRKLQCVIQKLSNMFFQRRTLPVFLGVDCWSSSTQ